MKKTCTKCGQDKGISEFYKHKLAKDGLQSNCIDCVKSHAKKRQEEINNSPERKEQEKKRHREKYYRLGYKEKHKPTSEQKKKAMFNYSSKYPEKISAKNRCSIKAGKGKNVHHWSYNQQHWNDVFILSISEHNKLHRYLRYDQESMMYLTLQGRLLDTKESHAEYYNVIKNQS